MDGGPSDEPVDEQANHAPIRLIANLAVGLHAVHVEVLPLTHQPVVCHHDHRRGHVHSSKCFTGRFLFLFVPIAQLVRFVGRIRRVAVHVALHAAHRGHHIVCVHPAVRRDGQPARPLRGVQDARTVHQLDQRVPDQFERGRSARPHRVHAHCFH